MANILITGGSRGLGHGFSLGVPNAGDRVWLVARGRPQSLGKQDGVQREWIEADLSLPESCEKIAYERAKASLPWVKDVSQGLVSLIGISELLGGLGMVLPLLMGILPWLTPLAAAGLALIMVLAMVFHGRRGETTGIVFNLVLFALAAFVVYGRWFMV